MQATETAVSSVTFPGSVLKALLKHTAKETSRYAINGIEVIIQGNTAQLTATDGYRLGRVRVNGYKPKPLFTGEPVSEQMAQPPSYRFLLSTQALKSLPGSASSTITIPCPDSQPAPGDTVNIYWQQNAKAAPNTASVEVMEGTFPPYDDVIPEPRAFGDDGLVSLIAVNPQFMTDGCDLCRACADSETMGLRLSIPDRPNKPIRMDSRSAENNVEATVVSMPINL